MAAAAAWPAQGDDGSAWVQGHRSRARLFVGGAADRGGGALAGVQIELNPGFKTYWRNPGESGIPATFDWSGSQNIAHVEVLWPAPTRFEDAAGVSYGYVAGVVFPLRVALEDPAREARISLKLDYGVCKDICIPAHAEMRLVLGAPGAASDRALLDKALGQVPVSRPLGAARDLSILRLDRDQKDPDQLLVAARVPVDSGARLFLEGPADWYFGDPQALAPQPQGDRDTQTFRVKILERPREPAAEIELTLTLTAGERSSETRARVDMGGGPR